MIKMCYEKIKCAVIIQNLLNLKKESSKKKKKNWGQEARRGKLI